MPPSAMISNSPTWGRLHLLRASWAVIDQLIVSAGSFLVNVLLARQLPPAQYGTFVLLFGGLITLQLFNLALLFHPLQIRLAVARGDDQARLLGATLILAVLLSVGLGGVLTLILVLVGHAELVPPTLSCFLLWQTQEAMRRGLLTNFRHRAASLSDSLSYIGQAVLVVGLMLSQSLTVVTALYAMAITSGFAVIVQVFQLDLRPKGPYRLRQTVVDYWGIGGLWSLGSNLLSAARVQVLPWALAVSSGPAAAASFQAAINVINLSNPITVAMANVIPQTAAQAAVNGNAHAWRAARMYAFVAAAPILLYSAVVLIAPKLILEILYGTGSGYLHLSLVVRLLVAEGLAGYAAQMVVSFLYGISLVSLAFIVNAVGALTTAALAIPLIGTLGLPGCCLALMGGTVTRLVTAHYVLTRTTAENKSQNGITCRAPVDAVAVATRPHSRRQEQQ